MVGLEIFRITIEFKASFSGVTCDLAMIKMIWKNFLVVVVGKHFSFLRLLVRLLISIIVRLGSVIVIIFPFASNEVMIFSRIL